MSQNKKSLEVGVGFTSTEYVPLSLNLRVPMYVYNDFTGFDDKSIEFGIRTLNFKHNDVTLGMLININFSMHGNQLPFYLVYGIGFGYGYIRHDIDKDHLYGYVQLSAYYRVLPIIDVGVSTKIRLYDIIFLDYGSLNIKWYF